MGGTRLREVVVEVGDVTAAVGFYRRRGFHLTKHSRWEGGDYAELSGPEGCPEGLKLVLVEGDGGVRLTFSVDDARAALADAAADGAIIQQPARLVGGGLWGTAVDPWGNPLGFWSPALGDR